MAAPQPSSGDASVFDPLLTKSRVGFAVLSTTDFRYLYASPSLTHLLGWRSSDLLGRPLSELVDDRLELRALLDDARRDGGACGRVRHAISSSPPPPDERSAAAAEQLNTSRDPFRSVEIKVWMDSELVHCVMVDALVSAKLEQSLREYLHTTSHDLRTPCVSVHTAGKLLAALPWVAADPEALSLLDSIEECTQILRKLINNVLMLRAGKGTDPARQSVFSLSAAFSEVQNEFRELSFPSQLPCNLPALVQGDRSYLITCLENMVLTAGRLSNVLCPFRSPERTPPEDGLRISLSVSPLPGAAGGRALAAMQIGLAFSCRRMSDDEVATMFLPYGLAPVDLGGGTGLALHVARDLSQLMGGSLTLRPHNGGMQIVLRLPLRVCAEGDSVFIPSGTGEAAAASAVAAAAAAEAAAFPSSGGGGPAASGDAAGLKARMMDWLCRNGDDGFIACRVEEVSTPLGAPEQVLLRASAVSPSVQRLLGYPPSALLGQDISVLWQAEDTAAVDLLLADAMTGSGQLRSQHRCLSYNSGETVWCELAGWVDRDSRRAVFALRDIRHRRKVEQDLRTFVISTRADLREPCNGILISTTLLEQRPALSQEAASLIAVVRASCSLLMGIVANVLTVRQVEDGTLTLNCVIFSPEAAISDTVMVCRLGCGVSSAPDYGIAWSTEQLPPLVEGDCDRILQITQNLINNACKFGGGNPVLVHTKVVHLVEATKALEAAAADVGPAAASAAAVAAAEAEMFELSAGELDKPAHLRIIFSISVSDSGRGLTQDEIKKCFDAYVHTAASSGGGSGLGLYISRAFAHLLGGTLTVVSEPGKLTTFTLQVPLRLPTEEEVTRFKEAAQLLETGVTSAGASQPRTEERRPSAALAVSAKDPVPPLRLLIADDHLLNLQLVSRLLIANGFEVVLTKNGQEALDALTASFDDAHPGSSFHAALLDMHMPVMSGLECTQAFRAWEVQSGNLVRWGRLPLVALTANVHEDQMKACFEAGMDHFLSKPMRDEAINTLRSTAAARCLLVEAKLGTETRLRGEPQPFAGV